MPCRRIEITSEGRRLCAYAQDILALRDRMMSNCSRQGHSILSISASTIPSTYILPSVLRQFGKERPDVYFTIHQSDSAGVQQGVKDGLSDLGLTGQKNEDPELICQEFCRDQMVLITPVTPYFLERKEHPFDIRKLLDQPVILREKGSGSIKEADRYLQQEGINEADLHVVARINDQEAIKNMVAGGLGISFISLRAAKDIIEARRVLCFPLPEGVGERSFYVIQRKSDITSDLRREFIRFLHGSFAGREEACLT